MKRLKVLMLIALFISQSCSLENDNTLFSFDIVAISEIEIPVEFEINTIVEIKTYYVQKSQCHVFYDYIFKQIKKNEIEVYLAETYIENGACEQENFKVERSFKLKIQGYDKYSFRFWNGRNEQGENQFITVEVPVNQ